MIYKKVNDPAALREEDNRRAEVIKQAAKIDYTMMMLEVEYPMDTQETLGEPEDAPQS